MSVRGGGWSTDRGHHESWEVDWLARAPASSLGCGSAFGAKNRSRDILPAFRSFLPARPEGNGAPTAQCSQASSSRGSGSLGSLVVLRRGKKVLSRTESWSTDDSDLNPRPLLWRTKSLTDASGRPVRGWHLDEPRGIR